MLTIFHYTLRKKLGTIFGWGIGLLLLGILLISMYDTIVEGMDIDFDQFMTAIPPEFMALFGGVVDYTSPEGFLSLEYFSYLPLMLGFVVVAQAGKLLVGMEEEGLLDLYLAYPIRRLDFFSGRILAEIVGLIGMLVLAYVGAVVPLSSSSIDVTAVEMIGPFLSLFALLLCFSGLSTLLSLVLPNRALGVTIANLVMIISFFINGFSSLSKNLEPLAKLLPFRYYQMGYSISDGINWEWFIGLTAVGLAGMIVSMVLFQRREIRVSGEGSWQFKLKSSRKTT